MPMKPCKECNWEISTDAPTCPFCGKRSPTGSGSAGVGGSMNATFQDDALVNKSQIGLR